MAINTKDYIKKLMRLRKNFVTAIQEIDQEMSQFDTKRFGHKVTYFGDGGFVQKNAMAVHEPDDKDLIDKDKLVVPNKRKQRKRLAAK